MKLDFKDLNDLSLQGNANYCCLRRSDWSCSLFLILEKIFRERNNDVKVSVKPSRSTTQADFYGRPLVMLKSIFF